MHKLNIANLSKTSCCLYLVELDKFCNKPSTISYYFNILSYTASSNTYDRVTHIVVNYFDPKTLYVLNKESIKTSEHSE